MFSRKDRRVRSIFSVSRSLPWGDSPILWRYLSQVCCWVAPFQDRSLAQPLFWGCPDWCGFSEKPFGSFSSAGSKNNRTMFWDVFLQGKPGWSQGRRTWRGSWALVQDLWDVTWRLWSKFTVKSFDITGICPDYLVAVGQALASLRQDYYLFLIVTNRTFNHLYLGKLYWPLNSLCFFLEK